MKIPKTGWRAYKAKDEVGERNVGSQGEVLLYTVTHTDAEFGKVKADFETLVATLQAAPYNLQTARLKITNGLYVVVERDEFVNCSQLMFVDLPERAAS